MKKGQEKSQSWWQTIQGILTASGAVIVAITGLIGALYQAGMIGAKNQVTPPEQAQVFPQTKKSSGSASVQLPQSSEHTLPVETQKGSIAVRHDPPAKLKTMAESQAIITTTAGDQVRVKAHTLSWGWDRDRKGLPLNSGLSVNFDKIKSFEILEIERTDDFRTYEENAGWPTVRITLWNEETITGKITESTLFLPHFFLNGSSELGDYSIRPWQLREVRFER